MCCHIFSSSPSRCTGLITHKCRVNQWLSSTCTRLNPHPAQAELDSTAPVSSQLELFEESKIVFDQHPDVRDGVFTHGDPVDAEAECPARILVRVETVSLQDLEHVRMDHPAPAQFDPAISVGEPDIHLGRGFGEGKETGTEAHLRLGSEIRV